MVIFKNQCNKGVWSFLSNIQDMSSENDDIIRTNEDMLNLTKSMLDPCGPNDDMWRKFALPITPPSSPPRSYGESSESEESTDDNCDIAERLQDVCENLDSTFDADDYRNFWRLTEAINIRSKLISDCMWSGEEARRRTYKTSFSSSPSSSSSSIKKLSVEIQEDLFPTPCPSPPASVTNTTDCLSSSECVDPTTVFPFPLQSESSSGQSSDSEEEIDVVTIDTKPVTLSSTPIGTKRRHCAIIKTSPPPPKTNSAPILSRVMNETVTLQPPEKPIPRKVSIVYESSDPGRRATHNVLERRRRIDLKNSFEKLRECVPNLENKEKSPKVVVLKRAAVYIDVLTKQDLQLEGEKLTLQKENQNLVDRLKKLGKC